MASAKSKRIRAFLRLVLMSYLSLKEKRIRTCRCAA
jgi:hypothetical protein